VTAETRDVQWVNLDSPEDDERSIAVQVGELRNQLMAGITDATSGERESALSIAWQIVQTSRKLKVY